MAAEISTDRTIFLEAVEYIPKERWDAFIKERCADDVELYNRVERLLRAHRELGEFQDHQPSAANAATHDAPSIEWLGSQIGPYVIREQIGEGGFGVVFLAEQERPVRRKVALKIIKPGMDTRQVIARFEAERQALAMMDHPNIAKVLDAGTTNSPPLPLGEGRGEGALPSSIQHQASSIQLGRPYFVMELVQGVPITEYCDQCNLTTHERLELFITVCHAVQHAHQKGIIHRDIKPTNVLVAMQDGLPAPKIIDFGVAKAMGEPLTEHTLTTAFAQMVGSPLYMSPEQAELSPLGVDTRSDIYSLGVLLYELLTGTTPFDKDRLHAASYDELRRIIREEDPPRPSARLSSLSLRERAGVRASRSGEPSRTDPNSLSPGETAGVRETANQATTIAEKRRTDPRRLIQTIRGELDWIVMKCLEKDRNRRYETPNSLARDIERYLHDEPVQACPPSTSYRFRTFARRNKTLLAAGGAIAAALVIGLGLSTWMYLRERAALQIARASLQYAEAWQLTVEAVGQLHVGDQAAYRATCKALVELPVADLDDETKLRQIFAWTIAPDALEDTSFVVKRAEELAANNSLRQHHLALYGLGAALYRDGRYDRAADELEKSIAAYPTNPARGYEVINLQRLMLAMSQWRQGKRDEARRLLAETKPAIDQEIQSPSTYFALKSTLEVLRREAETLIEPKEADEAVENKTHSSDEPKQ